MTSTEPGDRPPKPGTASPVTPSSARRLDRPPSARYERGGRDTGPGRPDDESTGGSALAGPLVRALLASVIGAAALFALGAAIASTVGLLFASGLTGAAVGLVLARAAAPPDSRAPVSRRTVTWLSIAIAIGAVALADVAIWVYAISEGGTLGFVDYLLTAFGPFVPGEAVVAALTAAWGANAGPIEG